MANVVVVGSQWGDEGKGKIVDWLSEQADIVVRFQGGHNAGHTLVINGTTYKLSLLPSGVVRPGKLSVIGNGVVLDARALLNEIEQLKKQGVEVSPQNLRIAENTPLILPLHQELDVARERASGKGAIGTTGRGIGPAYEDKVGRRAIRLMDLADLQMLNGKIDRLLSHHNALRRGLGLAEVTPAAIYDDLAEVAPKVLPYMDSVWSLLDEKRREGKRILFEGAQGALLDVDHGTYPYVTSSNTVAAQAATGSGLGPSAIDYVLGICKAYTTRVGEGPFPTEQTNDIGRRIGERGIGCGAAGRDGGDGTNAGARGASSPRLGASGVRARADDCDRDVSNCRAASASTLRMDSSSARRSRVMSDSGKAGVTPRNWAISAARARS